MNLPSQAAIPDLFLQLDYQGIVLDYKPGSTTDLYLPIPNPIGQPLQNFLPPSVAVLFQETLAQLSLGEPILSFNHALAVGDETRFYEARLLRVSAQVAIAIIRDITHRKRTEAELTAAKETAIREAALSREANLAKSQFLARMSHELRTPLNAILGFSQLMARDDTLNPTQQNYLGIINQSGNHLLDVINDILDLSKIEAGRITLNEQPFQLHRLLNTVRAMLAMKAADKGLAFHLDLDPFLPIQVEGDEQKLRQVLINLLGNAIKFTDRGLIRLRVWVISPIVDGRMGIEFQVIDTGSGIAPTDQGTLFEPFVQSLRRSDVQEGTGLGLTISQQFVQLMGGVITVKSALEQGTTFAFTLPLKVVVDYASRAPGPLIVTGLAPGQPNYHVLIVEDRETNRYLLEQLLQTVGFNTTAVCDGAEAITAWQETKPDFIWMDLQMPVLDGRDAAREIRALERAQGVSNPVPIAIMTASAFATDEATILALGCNALVRKPYTEKEIFETMAQCLGLTYSYREVLNQGEADLGGSDDRLLQQFHTTPMDWRQRFTQAVLEADGDEVQQLVAQLPLDCSDLANGVLQWLDNFEFETIITVLGL
ncbi:MAG: response regulator [Spirulina sp. DLM2.Bin59]|nr:MAG: response regulator [Spirulina sp. DLM2.Bin59]